MNELTSHEFKKWCNESIELLEEMANECKEQPSLHSKFLAKANGISTALHTFEKIEKNNILLNECLEKLDDND